MVFRAVQFLFKKERTGIMAQLSKEDIMAEINSKRMSIKPFNQESLQGASYDISSTFVAMSSKVGMLETVYRESRYPYKYFIYVKAKDTVLAISKEFVSVPSNMAGYVVSRVSKVSEGFGHVSTSIDPNWKGALLIALSNPSNKPIKVYVGEGSKGTKKGNTLATVTFHYLKTACGDYKNGYIGMRLDLLKRLSYTQRQGIRASIRKIIHPKRKVFTDFFFEFCESSALDQNHWEDVVKELQADPYKNRCVSCKHYTEVAKKSKQSFCDFVVQEHFLSRLIHWVQKNWSSIWHVIGIIVALLVALNILPENWKLSIKDIFESIS